MADWGCLGIDAGVVLYMCVDRVPAAYIRFTLSRLKNIGLSSSFLITIKVAPIFPYLYFALILL